LIVFLFIPLLGAIISVTSLLRGKGINVARLLSNMPIWSKSQQSYLHKVRQLHLEKQWFFLQSQAAAIAYSVASVLAFLLLLLTTDINFVWRSTVMEAEQLLPILEIVAIPWLFWDFAQPSLELLRATQDSRLTTQYTDINSFGQWWGFVLATQIVYSFMLRGGLLAAAKAWVKLKSQNDIEHQLSKKLNKSNLQQQESHKFASIGNQLPDNYVLTNWASFSSSQTAQLNLSPSRELPTGPQIIDDEEATGDLKQTQQLILVKAWEPPLGELEDYMQHGQGLIFPINTRAENLLAPEPKHLREWQRFTAQLPHWSIYMPEYWMQRNES